jgi:hypothetical protein
MKQATVIYVIVETKVNMGISVEIVGARTTRDDANALISELNADSIYSVYPTMLYEKLEVVVATPTLAGT